ncbi:CHAD domain-containing protein [Marinifilum caeruleilacunae]|uniref:CHAD domain-containing protein n=1 Tax=Marinifilum caeruleilacunae TaxID=2499076 RepID=A0ABX1WX05_9BACT|nr:CHAD domain-containing protein [Marinifilum caeruleilacunae]NOU60609.1 CHAD domain-containing protein [Marinifilum caeruleilacunae]
MNKLSAFYKKRFDGFLTHLTEAKNLDEENVHKLRVDIKNMRSLLLLVDALNLGANIVGKLLKQLRPIFKYSGRLRTIQVCKKLVEQHDIKNQEKVVKILEETKDQVSQEFVLAMEKFKPEKFQKRIAKLYQVLDEITPPDLRDKADKIIHDELDLIYKLWASSRGEEHYHDIRKFFKIIKSLLQLLIAVETSPDLEREYKIVNDTETILGDWHDRDVLDKKLAKIQKFAPNPEFKSLVREIKNKNRSEKNAFVKSFKQQMLTNFLKS